MTAADDDAGAGVREFVTAGLRAMFIGDMAAADVNFRHATHLCGDAATVVAEVIRQTGGRNRDGQV